MMLEMVRAKGALPQCLTSAPNSVELIAPERSFVHAISGDVHAIKTAKCETFL